MLLDVKSYVKQEKEKLVKKANEPVHKMLIIQVGDDKASNAYIKGNIKDAEELGVKDKDIVSVKIESNGRSLIFGDVVARVNDSYALAMHIDTDESNAVLAGPNCVGTIVK